MNKWQKVFLGFGFLSTVIVCVFPPQIVTKELVRFLPVFYGYPIDWFRLFLWLVAIFIATGLGIVANKSDHF